MLSSNLSVKAPISLEVASVLAFICIKIEPMSGGDLHTVQVMEASGERLKKVTVCGITRG